MSLNKTLLNKIMEQAKKKPKKVRVPRNQWQHPGEITDVNSPYITMQGVSYPVLGMSPDGTKQMMYPGGEYSFPSYPVREYPMLPKAQDGMEIDFRSVRQPKYDNIKSPNAKLEKLLKEDAARIASANKNRHGTIKNVPNGLADKLSRAVKKGVAIAGMPMTALSYLAKGQRIPDNFDKSTDYNPYDFAIGTVNPMDPIFMGKQAYDSFIQGDDETAQLALFGALAGTGAFASLNKGSKKAKQIFELAEPEEHFTWEELVKSKRPPIDNKAVSSEYQPFTFGNRKFPNQYKKDQAADALYRTIADDTKLENEEALARLIREARGYKKPKGASKVYDNLGEFLDENQMRRMMDVYGYNEKLKNQDGMLSFLLDRMGKDDFTSSEEKLLDRYSLKNKFRHLSDQRVANIYNILRNQHESNLLFDKEAFQRVYGVVRSPGKKLAEGTINSPWDSGKQLINNKDWFATAPGDELAEEMKNVMRQHGFEPSKIDDIEKFRTFYRKKIDQSALDSYSKKVTSKIFEGLSNNKYGGSVMQEGGETVYNPKLAKYDKAFQDWYKKVTLEGQRGIPYSDKLDYDYYSLYRSGNYKQYTPDTHFPDTFKRPGHETFSNESVYSTPENPGGYWQGEQYKPKGKFRKKYQAGGQLTNKSQDMYSFYDLMKYQAGGTKRQWHPEWDEDPLAAYVSPTPASEDMDMDNEMARLHQAAMTEFPMAMPDLKVKDNSYQGHSIVDFLQSYGYGSDFASRKAFAEALGITGYKGTAAQNLKLLSALKDNIGLLKQYKSVAPSTAKRKMTRSNSVAQTSKDVPVGDMFETAKSAYLLAHPGMTSEDYDSRLGVRENAGLGVGKPFSNKAVPGKFVDKTIDQMKRDAQAGVLPMGWDNENQAIVNDAVVDFFAKEVPSSLAGAVLPKLIKGIHWGTKLYPYNPYQIPEVVQASRKASRALPYATRAIGYKKGGGTYYQGNFYQEGGPVVGDEIEVTPEQLEALRQQGYDFEII